MMYINKLRLSTYEVEHVSKSNIQDLNESNFKIGKFVECEDGKAVLVGYEEIERSSSHVANSN